MKPDEPQRKFAWLSDKITIGGAFMTDLLKGRREEIAKACERHGVARLDVFGSALREDFRPDESDLDLLVEFKPMERTPNR